MAQKVVANSQRRDIKKGKMQTLWQIPKQKEK